VVSDCSRHARFQKQLNAIVKGQFLSQRPVAEGIAGKKRIFRKDATMLDPMIGTSTCSLCNATLESDTKLREHQRMAHRGRGNEERPQAAVVAEQSEDTGD
jgi:hypothetical protein